MVRVEGFGERYPREPSEGQRHHVGIARALSIEPKAVKGVACAQPVFALCSIAVLSNQISPS